jgi:hypothetical protein
MTVSARRNAIRAPWLVAALVSVTGCGGSGGVPRLSLYGTVAHPSGDKIDGSISFVPDQGRSGFSAVTSVVQGAYRFDKTTGPTAGPHRVIVTRTAGKEKKQMPTGPPKGQVKAVKNAPATGQSGPWTFTRDIPEKGPYQIDFQLP